MNEMARRRTISNNYLLQHLPQMDQDQIFSRELFVITQSVNCKSLDDLISGTTYFGVNFTEYSSDINLLDSRKL